MNSMHQELLQSIISHEDASTKSKHDIHYLGDTRTMYSVRVPALRVIAKDWAKAHKDISVKEVTAVIDSLLTGESQQERILPGILLGYLPAKLHQEISFPVLEHWLGLLVGWNQVDALCMSVWTAKDMMQDWKGWSEFLTRLSKSDNISKRRASLVLLTGPVGQTDDKRFTHLSFEVVKRVAHEKDILITKAVSWLLRSMVKRHKDEVSMFLEEHQEILPKIALRETRTKIRTGKK